MEIIRWSSNSIFPRRPENFILVNDSNYDIIINGVARNVSVFDFDNNDLHSEIRPASTDDYYKLPPGIFVIIQW